MVTQRTIPLLLVAIAVAAALASGGAHGSALAIDTVRFGNGGAPFAGDRALYTTVSPNGDGYRDAARIRFHLRQRARVTLQVLASQNRAAAPRLIRVKTRIFRSGWHRMTWSPPSGIEPRTYIVHLLVDGSEAAHAVVRVLGVDAGFTRLSYAPGSRAKLAVETDARQLSLQFFHAGPEVAPSIYSGYDNDELHGLPVSEPVRFDWAKARNHRVTLRLRLPSGPSGLYFARLTAGDRRVGFAPFVILPQPLGQHRVAVVFPTNTWEAYNHRDVNGDGWGDTWYAIDTHNTIDLTRPFLHRGVPTRFRGYQLGFLRWLYQTHKEVDFLTDDQLEYVSAQRAHSLYDLLVILGHHEYMTTRAYNVLKGYRNLGGNLMFTSTTNFLWRARRHGHWMDRTQRWRDIGLPEASLVGVEYINNDGGKHQGHYRVVGAKQAPWAFRGTGLRNGMRFGHGGIEVDKRCGASPPGTIVLASMPNLQGPGLSAEMTYYETRSGAKVFASGTLNFAGTALDADISRLLENIWSRLAQP